MMPNPMQLMNGFPQFMRQMQGQNPQQILNQMLQSGKVNQQQLNRRSRWHSRCKGSSTSSGECLVSVTSGKTLL